MKITVAHTKNVLIGWNVDVSIAADSGEDISAVEIVVDDFSNAMDSLNPPVSIYSKHIEQVGVYPGNNAVRVIVYDQNGNRTDGFDSWN